MASLKLDTLPLTFLKGVGPVFAKKLKQLGISSVSVWTGKTKGKNVQ